MISTAIDGVCKENTQYVYIQASHLTLQVGEPGDEVILGFGGLSSGVDQVSGFVPILVDPAGQIMIDFFCDSLVGMGQLQLGIGEGEDFGAVFVCYGVGGWA